MTHAADPRVAPIEDNLVEFLRVVSGTGMFRSDGQPDVATYWSDIDHPLFNGLIGARFPKGSEGARSREVIAPFLERGRPFLWWGTPSTWTPDLHVALTAAGMVPDSAPGMHVALRNLPAPVPVPGLEITVVTPETLPEMVRVMIEGFDMPGALVAPMHEVFGQVEGDALGHVLARLDGEPVGCGSVLVAGAAAGLYNIATLASARGRGVGYAVTRALLELARLRGCTEAILHASEMGRPVYERLGFVTVCEVPQYVWLPAS